MHSNFSELDLSDPAVLGVVCYGEDSPPFL